MVNARLLDRKRTLYLRQYRSGTNTLGRPAFGVGLRDAETDDKIDKQPDRYIQRLLWQHAIVFKHFAYTHQGLCIGIQTSTERRGTVDHADFDLGFACRDSVPINIVERGTDRSRQQQRVSAIIAQHLPARIANGIRLPGGWKAVLDDSRYPARFIDKESIGRAHFGAAFGCVQCSIKLVCQQKPTCCENFEAAAVINTIPIVQDLLAKAHLGRSWTQTVTISYTQIAAQTGDIRGVDRDQRECGEARLDHAARAVDLFNYDLRKARRQVETLRKSERLGGLQIGGTQRQVDCDGFACLCTFGHKRNWRLDLRCLINADDDIS